MNSPVKVVAGIIFRDKTNFLIARKKAGKTFEGHWEFPGGKIEKDEDPISGLKREIHEELAIVIEPVQLFHENEYHNRDLHILLLSYICKYVSGNIYLTDHDAIKWISIDCIRDYNFANPDQPIIEKLIEKFPSVEIE